MPARTSPPLAPRRLPWLALGLNAGLSSCSSWLAVPEEAVTPAETPPVSTVPAAPPPWQPPLEGSRYFGQRDPTQSDPLPAPDSAVSSGLPPRVPPSGPPASVDGARDGGVTGTASEPPASDAAVSDPGPAGRLDAASPPLACAGAEVFGICWYLGEAGESCEQTCAAHGGPAVAASTHVGTEAQGGSREDCVLILSALGQRYRVRGTEHDVGVGCHLPAGDGDPHWLSAPPFEATAFLRNAHVACGCND